LEANPVFHAKKINRPALVGVFLTLLLVAALGMSAGMAAGAEKRMKVIDFEDDVVEGMNKRPLDSLNYLSDQEKDRNRKRLYRKRVGFRTETQETLRELRYR
jgi:hypothetical protein